MNGEDIHQSENQPLGEGMQSLSNMPSFQEHILEGTRDGKEYQEFKAYEEEASERINRHKTELQERITKSSDESRSFLKTFGYTDDAIDSLLYGNDSEMSRDENSELRMEESSDKKHLKQSFESMFVNGISIKDLSDGSIIDMRVDSPESIDSFIEDFYFITDQEYFPDFTNRNKQPLKSLISIIDKRKKHEPLSKEDRDFAYDCYPESINGGSNYSYDKDNIADRLLFGGALGQYRAEGLLEETKKAIEDARADSNMINRVIKVEQQRGKIGVFARLSEESEKAYRESESRLGDYTVRNLHDIISVINGRSMTLDQELNPMEEEKCKKDLKMLGHLLLRYYDGPRMALFNPNAEKDGGSNPTKTGLGEAMIRCGISTDEILDTYFDGPKGREAVYESSYSYLEARRAKELMSIGIPKEAIVDNIRRKNEKNPHVKAVPIRKEEIKHMRDAGIDNADILDAICDPLEYIVKKESREFLYDGEGFTDDDIIRYLGKIIERKEKEKRATTKQGQIGAK